MTVHLVDLVTGHVVVMARVDQPLDNLPDMVTAIVLLLRPPSGYISLLRGLW